MKIATCTVSYAPATAEAENPARLEAYSLAMRELRARGVDLFALPAGYLYADTWPVLESLAERLTGAASESGIAVAAGVRPEPDGAANAIR
jgi:hypothetical protein